MESILKVKLFRGKLLQLLRAYQVVEIPLENFVVWGKTLQEHDKSLRKGFLKIR